GIRGQGDTARLGENEGPIERAPPCVELTEGEKKASEIALVAPQGGDDDGLARRRLEGGEQGDVEDGMGADFDEEPMPVVEKLFGGLGEADRLAKILVPISRIELVPLERGPGDRRIKRD